MQRPISKKLDRDIAQRILKKMLWVAANAGTLEHTGLTGQWAGLYRWRIGDYRVIYALVPEEHLLVADVIGHRKNVYDE